MEGNDGSVPEPMTICLSGDGYRAYLCIDSVFRDRSSGGVRIASDVSPTEVAELAREMSLKYAFFHLPRGGAKAGIALAPSLGAGQQRQILIEIGQRLGPIIRAGIYSPGMDMNCGPEDLRAIYSGAGIQIEEPTDTSYFTAISVANAIEACYEELAGTGQWTIAVEGFGRVAGHLMPRLSARRYRVVAISTLSGAVRNPDGFDPELLASQRARSGDDVVARVNGQPIPLEELFSEPVDLLLPAARTRTITSTIADRVHARVIVPVANAPYDRGVVGCLHGRGTLCLPGYVTNAGGVVGSSLYDTGLPANQVETLLVEHYRPMVKQVLARSRGMSVPPTELAERLAVKQLHLRRSSTATANLSARLAGRLGIRLPRVMRARKARRTFVANMASIVRELKDA